METKKIIKGFEGMMRTVGFDSAEIPAGPRVLTATVT